MTDQVALRSGEDLSDDQNYVLEITLVDSLGTPIREAELSLVNNHNGQPSARYSDGNGYTNHAVLGRDGDLITFQTNGYKIVASNHSPIEGPQYLYLSDDNHIQLQLSLDSFKRGYRPSVPVARSPLPPFGTPINYRTTLPENWPPTGVERDFMRGDAWGVVMPNAPVVPGSSTRHPERVLSWFVDRYTQMFQEEYLGQYDGLGYTHFKSSLADSIGKIDNGPQSPPGNARTLDQYIETGKLIKKYVRWHQVMLGSKYFMDFEGRIGNCAHNMSAQQWIDWAEPIVDELIKEKVLDELILGWEWNLWNAPGRPSIDAFKYFGKKCHDAGISFWQHFSPHYTSWQANDDTRGRFGWYDDLAGYVDGLNYQTMGAGWSNAMLQARMVDTLWLFGQRGNDFKMRLDEDYATFMWDNDEVIAKNQDDIPGNDVKVIVTPDYANQRCYIGTCTIDDVKHTDAKVWGYMNGSRRPDGSRL